MGEGLDIMVRYALILAFLAVSCSRPPPTPRSQTETVLDAEKVNVTAEQMEATDTIPPADVKEPASGSGLSQEEQKRLVEEAKKMGVKPAGQGGRRPCFSLEVRGSATEDIVRAMALQVGNTWLYDYTYESTIGSTGETIAVTCTRELSVVAHHNTPQGLVVLLDEEIRDTEYQYPDAVGERAVSWFKSNIPGTSSGHYLISNGYVYEISRGYWDEKEKALTPAGREYLPKACPTLFFPMLEGLRWRGHEAEQRDYVAGQLFHAGKGPAPNPGMYYWIVETVEDVDTPHGTVKGAMRMTYRALPDHTFRWFKEGLGTVKETMSHHGTYIETKMVLRDFRPSR